MSARTMFVAVAWVVGSIFFISVSGTAAWGVYGVRISDLHNTPLPPNPIKVWGEVTSTDPLILSDGMTEIAIWGITASPGDFLIVKGDWNGSLLIADPIPHIEMVYIPAGSFLMGNNGSEPFTGGNELPQHSVFLSSYWIGKYEVTRGEYRAFIDAGGYSDPEWWSSAGWTWKGDRTEPEFWAAVQDWRPPYGDGIGVFTQTDLHPVIGVSYHEAEAFCNWANGHLPTEAQWENAARWTGTYPNVYPWGNSWDTEKCNGLYDTNPAGGGYDKYQTAPVGSYPGGASPCGCCDMVGNASEWCKDWYGSSYYSQTPDGGWVDPQGPSSGTYRVVRGRDWGLGVGDVHGRCSYRDVNYPFSTWSGGGFRIVR